MKLCFAGIETPIVICSQSVAVLQIENRALFSRICQSLLSYEGEDAIEPYAMWEEDGKPIAPKGAYMLIPTPLELPWKHKLLLGGLHLRLEEMMSEDYCVRDELERAGLKLSELVTQLGFQLNADYAFALEWNMRNYLKAFDFRVDIEEDARLFENLMQFFDHAADMRIDIALVFVGLKSFLQDEELAMLYERAFFLGIKLLLLENAGSEFALEGEEKVIIDQDFLECKAPARSERSSSTQGRICSNGFGAVTF